VVVTVEEPVEAADPVVAAAAEPEAPPVLIDAPSIESLLDRLERSTRRRLRA
jgi:hypothetical protein